MMWLDEFVLKLLFFIILGYLFVLVELVFLSVTEDIPLKKQSFNIFNSFPLSYGLFLPIFCFFLSSPYYPVGSTKFRDFPVSFEVEHLSSKLFSYLSIVSLVLIALDITSIYYEYFNPLVMLYLGWFFQVSFSFLILQLIPFYPTLMGIALLREIKYIFIKYNKLQMLFVLPLLAEIATIMYIFFILSLNFYQFNHNIQSLLECCTHYTQQSIFFVILGVIFSIMLILFYIKKREYNRYLEYIKSILKDAFLKDSSTSH